MNFAIVLSGGTGTRLKSDIPKQYIEVAGSPIIMYCLKTLQESECIDRICVVAADEWQQFLNDWIEKCNVTKFIGFAPAGASRQHSILNGLDKAAQIGAGQTDNCIIHDAARPNLSKELIARCMKTCEEFDGVLPVIPVKDTVYLSEDGKNITSLLNRDQLFAGQAPEAFNFGKYYDINRVLTVEELGKIRGSSEIAYSCGLKVGLVEGDENNYKITTAVDLEKFIDQRSAEKEG